LLTLPEVNLHVVPNSISNEEAVFVEPLAATCEILDQATIPEGARIAVLGDGKLGLLIAQVLTARCMISDSFPLSQAPRAFQRAAERGILKVVLNAG